MTARQSAVDNEIILLSEKRNGIGEIVHSIDRRGVHLDANQVIRVLHGSSGKTRSHLDVDGARALRGGLGLGGQLSRAETRTTKFVSIHVHGEATTSGDSVLNRGVGSNGDVKGSTVVGSLALGSGKGCEGRGGPIALKRGRIPTRSRSSTVEVVSPEGFPTQSSLG